MKLTVKYCITVCLTLALGIQTANSQSRFTPSHGAFFRQAFKSKGPVTAVLATTDRMVRDTRIGLATSHYIKEDGLVHEDFFGPVVEPYKSTVFDFSGIDLNLNLGKPVSSELGFIDYLLGNNLQTDAVYYLHGAGFAPSDTLDFYRAKALYTAGGLDLAAATFKKIPAQSSYYEPSVFLNTVCDVYLGDYGSAVSVLSGYDGTHSELKSYELAAISLLQNDANAYKSYAQDFTYSGYAMAEGEKTFDRIYHERFEAKTKSPWVAAGLSTIVPGLGKFYSGRYGEGAASFLLTGTFIGFSAESWIKNGGSDWRTILFTTVATLLHISNIYGSYISVELYNSYLENAQNETIVFHIHVPVRSIFR